MKQVDLKNCAVLLTKTGLACLTTFENGKPLNDEDMTAFYCSNDGIFRRYMSRDEFNSLCGLLPQVHVAVISDMICELPDKWQFLWSWRISDFTQHQDGLSSNGGCYAFYETHFIFGRINAGKLELLDVVRYRTSAEFDYDEVNASFQSGLGKVTFLDCEDADFCLYAQTSYGEDEVWSLNQVGNTISFQDALEGCDMEIDGDEVHREDTYIEPRLLSLKETLGWEPTKRR